MFGWTFEKLLPVWDRGDLCCYVFCSAWGRVDPCCCVWGRVDLCCCVQLEVGETSVGRVQFGWGRGERFGWSEVRSDGLTEVGVTSVRSEILLLSLKFWPTIKCLPQLTMFNFLSLIVHVIFAEFDMNSLLLITIHRFWSVWWSVLGLMSTSWWFRGV